MKIQLRGRRFTVYLWASGISGSIWTTVLENVDKLLPPLNSDIRALLRAITGLWLPSKSSASLPQNVRVTYVIDSTKIIDWLIVKKKLSLLCTMVLLSSTRLMSRFFKSFPVARAVKHSTSPQDFTTPNTSVQRLKVEIYSIYNKSG